MWLRNLNGQEYWALTMGASVAVYLTLSLLGPRRRFDLDQLLHRGSHEVAGETTIVTEAPSRGWRMLGMGREFTRADKIIYVASYIWTGAWTIVFIVGTIYNQTHEVADLAWARYWRVYVYVHLAVSAFVIVWFTVGGLRDARAMFRRLAQAGRDSADDGFVR
ncbi:MAG: hypothetical protein ACYTDY_04900 [Planctomycetota bacterium]